MLALLHSIVAIPLIYVYTMVMATISLSVSFIDHDGRRQHWCAHTWCRLIAATAGMRVRVFGLENLPAPGTPVVYMANHQSYMDIPVLYGFLPVQFRIIAKESLFKVPFMGWHLTRAGNIPINRSNRREAMRSMDAAAERIREGTPVVVFPEGTRSRNGVLQDFKAGSFKLATSAGVPIVPISIIGTCKIMAKDSLLIRPGIVEMHISAPISTVLAENEPLERLMNDVRAEMAAPLIPRGLAEPGAAAEGAPAIGIS
ncbi:MAG TPA: lysophospholipid acyltransferase family protein [Blastocatellia bacterium]|nr:lysophospholipid acyltransferase family protein [Blastocatellia bacterium]